jgi:hypothetical protein
LAELAAVGDEHRILRIEQLLHGSADFHRMQRPLRVRRDLRPPGGRQASRSRASSRQPLRGQLRRDAACVQEAKSATASTIRHDGENTAPNFSMKSCFFPASTIVSAAASTSAKRPSAGSLIPRGLSIAMTGTPVISSNCAASVAPGARTYCGPARTIGREARASPSSHASPPAGATRVAIAPPQEADRRSPREGHSAARHAPGPDAGCSHAHRKPMSLASAPAERVVQDAFAAGAAISAWRIS